MFTGQVWNEHGLAFGDLDLTVSDSTEFNIQRHFHPDLRVALDLDLDDPIAWAFPKGSGDRLLSLADDFLIKAGHYQKLKLEPLSERRQPVFAGGVSVLMAVFDALDLEHIQIAEGALREGILYELIGRYHNEDTRNITVNDMAARNSVDAEQAGKVAHTAEKLFNQVKKAWQLDSMERDLLLWSATLHEIGLTIAHAQYHRHGAYLLSNSNMPGFSRQEQINLAMLVRAHRRKFPVQELEDILLEDRKKILRLAILLRISYVMNRSRSYTAPPIIKATAADNSLQLQFPKNWLEAHPLTRADLDSELDYLQAVEFKLACS